MSDNPHADAASSGTTPECRDAAVGASHELVFHCLHRAGNYFAFACDAQGAIDEAEMTQRQRNSLDYVRSRVGVDYGHPVVVLRLAEDARPKDRARSG